jgi:hypothetical protein
MTLEVRAMIFAGITTLVAGALLARPRLRAASGWVRLMVLAPVFEAAPLATFSMEHFLDGREMMPGVPRWLPWHLFWIYFFGAALVAAALSFILWRSVRWSAPLLALFFLLIVAFNDLPNLVAEAHKRIFWSLTVRELVFGAGALVLAGSVWPKGAMGQTLVRIGRGIFVPVLVFYAFEHFLFPRYVPGVPLEKLIPGWMPAPELLSYLFGAVLLLAAIGLLNRKTVLIAAAGAGAALVLLTALFYLPISIMEIHSSLAVEGINYVGDTLLFAATVMLAGFDTVPRQVWERVPAVPQHKSRAMGPVAAAEPTSLP